MHRTIQNTPSHKDHYSSCAKLIAAARHKLSTSTTFTDDTIHDIVQAAYVQAAATFDTGREIQFSTYFYSTLEIMRMRALQRWSDHLQYEHAPENIDSKDFIENFGSINNDYEVATNLLSTLRMSTVAQQLVRDILNDDFADNKSSLLGHVMSKYGVSRRAGERLIRDVAEILFPERAATALAQKVSS